MFLEIRISSLSFFVCLRQDITKQGKSTSQPAIHNISMSASTPFWKQLGGGTDRDLSSQEIKGDI